MELIVDLPGRFWPSTVVACLERALAASFGYGYVGPNHTYMTGATRWRWEEIHDPAREHHPGVLSSAGVAFRAWEEGRMSFLGGFIRFWRRTGNNISFERTLKDMKTSSIALNVNCPNTATGVNVDKICHRLCSELQLSGEAV